MYRLMIVDDEENILHSLKRNLSKQKEWDIVTCNDPLEAIEIANTSRFDLFLSDYRMPGMNGVEFLVETKKINQNAMRIILSGATDFNGLMDAINKAEIYRFISKPVDANELIQTISHALQFYEILKENRILAAKVRAQESELSRRALALKKLAKEHPLIAQVNWGDDGSIILDEDDLL